MQMDASGDIKPHCKGQYYDFWKVSTLIARNAIRLYNCYCYYCSYHQRYYLYDYYFSYHHHHYLYFTTAATNHRNHHHRHFKP